MGGGGTSRNWTSQPAPRAPRLPEGSLHVSGTFSKLREAKAKDEVSVSDGEWGQPPHLLLLPELMLMVLVVISRC